MRKVEDFLITGLLSENRSDRVKNLSPEERAKLLDPSWDWKQHSPEENKLRGIVVDDEKRQQYSRNVRDLASRGLPAATSTGRNTSDYWVAKNLMDAIQQNAPQEEIDLLAAEARKQNEIASQARASERSSERSPQRISPMYWVTHGDFKSATGEDYDARNPRHRQIFFDLNARGESTSAPSTGVGQGPAYDSLEYHTMRRRPKDIPQYGGADSWYDKETGVLAPTTDQSRRRKKEEEKNDQNIDELGKAAAISDYVFDMFNTPPSPPSPAPTTGKGRHAGDQDAPQGGMLNPEMSPPDKPMFGGMVNWAMDTMKLGLKGSKPKTDTSGFEGFGYPNEIGTPGMGRHPGDSDFQRGQHPIYPPENGEDTTQSIKITPDLPSRYVAPESEEWNKLSDEEKVNMALGALQNDEVHKFFGGREKKKGGFLGFGGERTVRFSEDNSGDTPSDIAYKNRVAKMLNKLLDEYDSGIKSGEGGTEVVNATASQLSGNGSARTQKGGFDPYSTTPQSVQAILNRTSKKYSTKDQIPVEPIPSDEDAFEKAYQEWLSNQPEEKVDVPVTFRSPTGKFDPEMIGAQEQGSDEDYKAATKRSRAYNKASQEAQMEFLDATGKTRPETAVDNVTYNKLLVKYLIKNGFDYDYAKAMVPLESRR